LATGQRLLRVDLGHVAVALAAKPLLGRDYSIVIFLGSNSRLGARQQVLIGGPIERTV
jgi:hypothetical protein